VPRAVEEGSAGLALSFSAFPSYYPFNFLYGNDPLSTGVIPAADVDPMYLKATLTQVLADHHRAAGDYGWRGILLRRLAGLRGFAVANHRDHRLVILFPQRDLNLIPGLKVL